MFLHVLPTDHAIVINCKKIHLPKYIHFTFSWWYTHHNVLTTVMNAFNNNNRCILYLRGSLFSSLRRETMWNGREQNKWKDDDDRMWSFLLIGWWLESRWFFSVVFHCFLILRTKVHKPKNIYPKKIYARNIRKSSCIIINFQACFCNLHRRRRRKKSLKTNELACVGFGFN